MTTSLYEIYGLVDYVQGVTPATSLIYLVNVHVTSDGY